MEKSSNLEARVPPSGAVPSGSDGAGHAGPRAALAGEECARPGGEAETQAPRDSSTGEPEVSMSVQRGREKGTSLSLAAGAWVTTKT